MVTQATKFIFSILPCNPAFQRVGIGVAISALVVASIASIQCMGKVIINSWLIIYDERPLMTAGIWEAEYFIYVVSFLEVSVVLASCLGLLAWGIDIVRCSANSYFRKDCSND